MIEVKRVVLLGCMGSGKTSLFNLITQQQESTRYGGGSVTQLVTVGQSNSLYGFEIIDTPGFSPNETIVSLAGIFVGLYYGHINRILVVVKYDRVQYIMRDIKQIVEKIEQTKPIITIVVTHWDLWQQRDNPRGQEQILSKIKTNFEIESILFLQNRNETRYNQQNSNDISNQIQQILLRTDEVFTFRVTEDVLRNLGPQNQEQIEQATVLVQQNFRQIAKCYQQYLNNFNFQQPNAINILHQLQLDFKQRADKMIEEFVQKYGEQMNEEFEVDDLNQSYFQYIYLKQKITIDYQQFLQQVQEKMIKNNIQQYSFIKRCPNCKLVWIKVSGCDGKVYCGQLSNSFDLDQQNQVVDQIKKYKFFIINNQLNLEERIIQTDQTYSINLIKKFVIENKLIEQNNQEQIMDIVKSELQNYKEKIILLKQQYQNLMQQREEHKNNIFHNFNELAELYREIVNHYLIIFQNEISKDSNNCDSCSMSLKLISEEEPPQYVEDCSFLKLNFEEWLNQINQSNQGQCLHIIKQILSQKQIHQIQQSQINNSQLQGCKKSFIWKDQPPISREELLKLFSQEVLDYLSDPNRFIADENNQLDIELKQIFNISLNEGMKKVKILQNIE